MTDRVEGPGARAPIHDGASRRRSTFTRRDALQRMGIVAVGLAVTPVPGWPASWFRPTSEIVPFTDVPPGFDGMRGSGPEDHPGQNRVAQDLRALESWITPAEDFFFVGHYGIPEIDADRYRLQVTGFVEQPVSFSLTELRSRPRVERTTVFECAGNSRALLHGMVGNATWAGTPLASLLAEAVPARRAREVHFWAADSGTEAIRGGEYEQSFARSMSLTDAWEAGPILAYEMNGEPLPVVHGFPVRLIVPGWYGVAQVKWLERIDLSPDRLMTRFMARDYVTIMGREVDGQVEWTETSVTRQRVKSLIARVTRTEERFTIFGAAWSDGTPLDRVDVRIDDGEWRPATLDRPGGPYTWTFFSLEVDALPPGEHTLVSRATDVSGRTQPVELSMKRTRWENNELFVRTIAVT